MADGLTIATQSGMVSVTQAFAVDLTGQVCADEFRGELYGGVATQLDFHRGAARSPGGKPIVCLASRTDDGEPRIQARLHTDEGVAIPRSDVHYVITEYGVAYLFGRSIRERAVALIEVAHPDDRDHLMAEAKRLGLVPEGQILRSRTAYPTEAERSLTLRNGMSVLLRPTRTSDTEAMQDLFYALRPQDVYTRFFTNLASLSDNKARICAASTTTRRWPSSRSSARTGSARPSSPAARTTWTRPPASPTSPSWCTPTGKASGSARPSSAARRTTPERTACVDSPPTYSSATRRCSGCSMRCRRGSPNGS